MHHTHSNMKFDRFGKQIEKKHKSYADGNEKKKTTNGKRGQNSYFEMFDDAKR